MVSCIIQIQSGTNFHYTEDDVIISVLPLFHIYGNQCVGNACPFKGSLTILLPSFDPTVFLTAVQKYKATYLPLVPPIVLFLAKHPAAAKVDFSSVKVVGSGAAPMTQELEDEFRARFKNVFLQQGYGM